MCTTRFNFKTNVSFAYTADCVLLNTSKNVIVFPNGKNWTVLVIGPQFVYTDISTEYYLTKLQNFMGETLIFHQYVSY